MHFRRFTGCCGRAECFSRSKFATAGCIGLATITARLFQFLPPPRSRGSLWRDFRALLSTLNAARFESAHCARQRHEIGEAETLLVLLTSGLLEQHAQPAMAVPLKSSDGLRCI